MPQSSTLWMAAGTLWILDTSINVSMEPFRAFITDKLPDDQRTRGFSMQSVFYRLGARWWLLALPWMMANWFHVSNQLVNGDHIPPSVRYSFYIGAFAFITAVLYTIITSTEYPPADITERQKAQNGHKKALVGRGSEIFFAILATCLKGCGSWPSFSFLHGRVCS